MPASDEALMCQIQKGDMKSFDLLVKRWEKPLLNHCYRLVDNIQLSEDLRQEVFLRVYRSAKTYKPIAKFSTWVYRIATNLCLDTLAKRRRRKVTSLDSESQDFGEEFIDPARNPDEMVVNMEIQSQVRLALSCLPEDLRTIVVMRHYDGLKFREIAEILRCPVSTVKSRMVSGMQRLTKFQ